MCGAAAMFLFSGEKRSSSGGFVYQVDHSKRRSLDDVVTIGVDVEVSTQISYASVAASRWVHSTTAGGEMNALAER